MQYALLILVIIAIIIGFFLRPIWNLIITVIAMIFQVSGMPEKLADALARALPPIIIVLTIIIVCIVG